MIVVRKLLLFFLNVSSSMRDVRIHGLLGFHFLGELVHFDGEWDKGLVRENDVQQERKQDYGCSNNRDDHVRGIDDERDIKSTSQHKVARV